MDSRRDFLKGMSLIPLSFIPFTKAPPLSVLKQTRKTYEERFKYLDYSKQDYMWCKLILVDDKGNKLWAPPITEVTINRDPYHATMFVEHLKPPTHTLVAGIQFVDKDKRTLFQPSMFDYPVTCVIRDTLQINYSLRLD